MLVKSSGTVAISILKEGDRRLCVKQFRYLSLRSRLKACVWGSKGLRAWVGGNGLKARGVPTLDTLALVERREGLGGRDSFLLMEALEEGQELDRYVVRGFDSFRRKKLFIVAFAHWLSALHKKKIYHRDMKTCNVWVSEKGERWEFLFLDLEDLSFDATVSETNLFRNLLQLNSSIPKRVSRTDRLRFFYQYLDDRPLVLDRKDWIRRLIRETQRRGVVYVAPWGVVEE